MPSYNPDPFIYLRKRAALRGGTSPDILVASGDIANGVYTGGSFSDLFTFTRASIATDLLPEHPANRGYTTFQANTPVIVPGVGGYDFDAATQLLANPVNPTTPEGGIALTAGWYSMWCNAGSMTVTAGTAVLGGAGTATTGAPVVFRVVTAGTVDISYPLLPACAQLEAGDAPTSFMPVGGMTRVQDTWSFSALGLAPLNNASGTVVVNIRGTVASGRNATNACFLRMNGAVLNRNACDASFFTLDSNGGNAKFYGAGYGDLRSGVCHVESWSPADRRLTVNGGCLMTSTKLRTATITAARLAAQNSTSHTNGIIRSFAIYNGQMSDAVVRSLSAPVAYSGIMLGDSMTTTNYGSLFDNNQNLPALLTAALGKTVMNYGVEGDLASTALARFITNRVFDKSTIILLGTNISANTVADIASIVALLQTSQYLIVSGVNFDNTSGRSGGANYTTLTGQLATLASTYGVRYCDLRSPMVAAGNPADAYDAQCITWDVLPASLRRIDLMGYSVGGVADATTQSFTLPFSPGNGQVVKVGDEYIYVATASGATVSVCTRGFNGSPASAHPVGAYCAHRDTVHLNQAGRQVATALLSAKITSLGWTW